MLGGYQILDLRNIDLSRSTSETSITDSEVLKQLLNIREHIQKSYDFSEPLHAQLKPVLIRYRDKKVGEKHEVACYGNIEVINTYYKFRIIAINEGEQLTINVEFEEKTDEYSNKYWGIKTAKVLLTSAEQTIENILAEGNVENAKPIFCHPLTIYTGADIELGDGKTYSLLATAMIFNNSDSEIDTFEKLVEASKSFHRLQVNGVLFNTDDNIAVEIMQIYTDTNSARPVGVALNDGFRIDEQIATYNLYGKNIFVIDGVNKIN